MFGKKPQTNVLSRDERVVPILERRQELTILDINREDDRAAICTCLKSDVSLAKTLDLTRPDQLAILKVWLKDNYRNYLLCHNCGVQHPDLLFYYLKNKLRDDAYAGNQVSTMALATSLDKKLIFNYSYTTKQGETIAYFDQLLGVPTSLVVNANLKLKLLDAQKLLTRIDIDVPYIDLSVITDFITCYLSRVVRDTVLSFIREKELSYYDLPQHYTALNQSVEENLGECLKDSGLVVVSCLIRDINVTDNTDVLLRHQFFALAEDERVKAHEQRLAQAALDLYERKAAIHEKYPNFPLSLTEAEKDLAMNRYLMRMGRDTTLRADIKEIQLGIRETRRVDKIGTEALTPNYPQAKFKGKSSSKKQLISLPQENELHQEQPAKKPTGDVDCFACRYYQEHTPTPTAADKTQAATTGATTPAPDTVASTEAKESAKKTL